METAIRSFMPRQVVVIPGMMIARASAMIAERADDGQVVGLAGEIRQMLAQGNAGRLAGGDGLEILPDIPREHWASCPRCRCATHRR